jgi:hypothetical protein
VNEAAGAIPVTTAEATPEVASLATTSTRTGTVAPCRMRTRK